MRLGKSLKVWLIVLVLLVFTAGSVQAGGVVEEWVARYNGPGNGYDVATAIAADGSGNVYVTGYSYGSGTSFDYATIKYDPNGNQLWVARHNGPVNGDDYARAIAIDGSGNIYVTGCTDYFPFDESLSDYATIKYDSSGNELWVRRYNGPGNGYDYVRAIAVDVSGNIYITGYSTGSGTYDDYATIKYDPNGNQLWVCRYNGPADVNDWAYAIALDVSGNIYITGYSTGSGTFDDYATIKYDSAGNELWVRRYDGPGNGYDRATAIAVDGSGNIYVTGQSWGSSGTSHDYATIKYDTNGNELWVRRYNGPGNGSDYANAIAVDDSGNIYVTGRSTGFGTSDDYATIKYDSAGGEQWVRRYNGPGNGGDSAFALAVDGSGNIYVTGTRYGGSGTSLDYATIKYSQYDVVLTMQTSPPEVNTVIPEVGEHYYLSGAVVNINAQRLIDCPDVYVFGHWEGDVNDPNSANTTVLMDTDKTVKAVFVDGRQCGDECHPYPAGDLDKDCEVTFSDFALFVSHWLDCTKPECD